MKILITGHTGQVARELQRALAQHELVSLGRADFDLAQPQKLGEVILRERPTLVINAAAYTAVDQAEQERELAFTINAEAPGAMADACFELDIPLIHYSTDYVFDGSKATAYREADTPRPLGVYGASKAAGEQALRISGCEHLILRTSWVYSQHGRNFLLTMQRLLQEREQLKVVDDQIGAPTWAGSIASATAELIEKWQQGRYHWGTYHLTCQGQTSWFGFASAIAERLRAQGKHCAELLPIPSSDYPTPARRPLNSRLDGERLAQDWQVSLPHWEQALDACLSEPQAIKR
ncbi:dTDP-4-dehydrorhamnose reductase subunit, NAD(P)-binding, of dTDP-L-rhamnose synthase [Pseudomonas sp. 8Z]|uniref:dTDP-4-dehydrorhamnose reductase n=1 Tax=Pseudomonas sp. 8Z TaxID=2653166 RepID=UPI0012EF4671|nr:dTDP-4-dehydrorhamnose reductase [Pseudomonas sp. 8Z]VXC94348.1 dTDP-4-dehydrorhamnose reductase subunit, NAD(P)-binding, of dTDP-L-rhamnose synthase [Pseudomonas sp. 8Z]